MSDTAYPFPQYVLVSSRWGIEDMVIPHIVEDIQRYGYDRNLDLAHRAIIDALDELIDVVDETHNRALNRGLEEDQLSNRKSIPVIENPDAFFTSYQPLEPIIWGIVHAPSIRAAIEGRIHTGRITKKMRERLAEACSNLERAWMDATGSAHLPREQV